MILVKSPYRVSLFGGGTDYTDFIIENGMGLCIGFAIDKYSYVGVRELPRFFNYKTRIAYSEIECVNNNIDIKHDGIRHALQYMNLLDRNLEITHTSDLPAKTGLGTSSAFLVALTKALYEYKNFENIGPVMLGVTASNIEKSYSYVGIQDHLFSAFGSCGELSLSATEDKTDIKKITYYKYAYSFYDLLERNGLLFYTGVDRISSNIVKTYIDTIGINKNQQKILEIAKYISKMNRDNKLNLEIIGGKLHETWMCKKGVSNNISCDHVDSIYNGFLANGAIGGKLCGGGGNGCIFILADPSYHDRLIRFALGCNCIHIPFKIDLHGVQRIL